jgi:hypothetical protein
VTTYKAGESFSELPGDRRGVSANASESKPAKLLAVFVLDTNETELTIPFGNWGLMSHGCAQKGTGTSAAGVTSTLSGGRRSPEVSAETSVRAHRSKDLESITFPAFELFHSSAA